MIMNSFLNSFFNIQFWSGRKSVATAGGNNEPKVIEASLDLSDLIL